MRRLLCLILSVAVPAQAVLPVITSFTLTGGGSTIWQGVTFQLCWTVSNAPDSITITPGLAGNQTIAYIDSTNPASGCATFTPPIARFRVAGDSITCGFRNTGGAANTSNTDLPCQPNPNPNGAIQSWAMRTVLNLQQMGYSIPVYQNLAVVGATALGHTPDTCTGSPYNPDVLGSLFGANDVSGKTTNAHMDTVYTNLTALWAPALASGCLVVPWTITQRSSAPAAAVLTYLNDRITNTPALFSAVIDIGHDANMGCGTCNLFNNVPPDGNTNLYFSQLDCAPCSGGNAMTHYSDAGQIYTAKLATAAIAAILRARFTITATNVSGTTPQTTLSLSVKQNVPVPVFGGNDTVKLPSLDVLRMIFGFALLVILAFLTGAIALGHVEEKTSYGLIPLLTTLSTLAGGFATWAFASFGGKGKDDEK